MRAKSLALLLLALGCGLVASIGITQVMAKRDTKPAQVGETVPVFVAIEDIPLREFVTAQMLKVEEWPKGTVPPGAIGKIEDIEGRMTKSKVYTGEPILDAKLFGMGDDSGGIAARIPAGYRVIPVKVDAVSGGAAMIRPGDRVDVTVFIRASKTMELVGETGTRTLLEDIKVFAVDGTVELDPDAQGLPGVAARTISLLLKPKEAAKVQLAMKLGEINLVMRGYGGSEGDARIPSMTIPELFDLPKKTEAEPSDSSFDQFLDQAGKAPETPSEPTAEVPIRRRPKDSWVVRIWSGSKRKDMLLQAERSETDKEVVRWVIDSPEPEELEAIIEAQSVDEPTPKQSESKQSGGTIKSLIEQLISPNGKDAVEELQRKLSEGLPQN